MNNAQARGGAGGNGGNGKTLVIREHVTIRSSTTIRGDSTGGARTIHCWCGASVAGKPAIVEEAHRQHLLNHAR